MPYCSPRGCTNLHSHYVLMLFVLNSRYCQTFRFANRCVKGYLTASRELQLARRSSSLITGTSAQCWAQRYHHVRLKWAMMGVCTLWKLANTANQDFPPESQLWSVYRHTAAYSTLEVPFAPLSSSHMTARWPDWWGSLCGGCKSYTRECGCCSVMEVNVGLAILLF